MLIDLYIGDDKLEIFGNENITLTSSVTDINDITKNLTDITKSFTVPASDVNNQIFKHYYNANIDNTFDARTKVNGRIELDGMPFRYGKYRLEKVKIKGGQPSVYTIQFWGKGINLKDIIGDDELSALDLSAYDHDYNSNNVKLGLTDGLFSGAIKYSMFAKKQYYYNSDGADPVQTSILSNIAYNSGGVTGVLWNDLKPSIGLINIIEAIESKYTIAFSRDFFGREEFTKLYLWLNNSATNPVETEKLLDVTKDVEFTSVIGAANLEVSTSNNWFKKLSQSGVMDLICSITPKAGFENIPYKIRIKNNDNVHKETEILTGSNFVRDFMVSDEEYKVYVVTSKTFEYNVNFRIIYQRLGVTWDTGSIYQGDELIDITSEASTLVPKIKTMDFLRGLFSMFKLL
jgi:hypothetical protein